MITVTENQVKIAAERIAYLDGLDETYTSEEVAIALSKWLTRHLDEVLAEPECFANLKKLLPEKQIA